MGRRTSSDPDAAGSDSFLDITTNIVGILIILVMVVGERAKMVPVEASPAPPSAELVAARGEAVRLEQDVHDLAHQMTAVQSALQMRAAERNQLATLMAAVEQELEARRVSLDDETRQRYEQDRDLALTEDELARLDAERRAAEQAAAPQTVTVKNYPAPLGKTVNSDEVHFRLSEGRLTMIPYQQLMNELQRSLPEAASRMQHEPELVDTLGPIEGFRLRYVVQRHDTLQARFFQLAYVEFIPISNRLGEPVDDALKSGSKFRDELRLLSPDHYTITIWTYPDSFAEYRQVKDELYALGYQVAARPLPEGMPIGAAPSGSKSSAQ